MQEEEGHKGKETNGTIYRAQGLEGVGVSGKDRESLMRDVLQLS